MLLLLSACAWALIERVLQPMITAQPAKYGGALTGYL